MNVKYLILLIGTYILALHLMTDRCKRFCAFFHILKKLKYLIVFLSQLSAHACVSTNEIAYYEHVFVCICYMKRRVGGNKRVIEREREKEKITCLWFLNFVLKNVLIT